MNALDYVVLLGTILGIAGYGMWRTRARRDLSGYLKGAGTTPWFIIGLSVMATQASAVTFLSTPGQGYQSGLGFLQNYFGAPFALIIIAVFFLPIYRRLNVYTAYEFLSRRFDTKTRLLGVGLFLIQRGLGAAITIYTPAIVLSTVFGWPLDLTIIGSGLVVTVYTVSGGSDAVTVTQKYQIGMIFVGMVAAFFILLAKLPAGLSLSDALTVAGGFHKLNAVNFSPSLHERYTFWSGLIGGMFLALTYFGTDQSQVQRYISGGSLRESRLGLMFNAVFKIPMQFFILLLGVFLFVFYEFGPTPVFFNNSAAQYLAAHGAAGQMSSFDVNFAATHSLEMDQLKEWLQAKKTGDQATAERTFAAAVAAHDRSQKIRDEAKQALDATHPPAMASDTDYVFITFILHNLPHGLIGLLVAVFFAAALSSKAAELNALGSATTVDLYRHIINRDAGDAHYVVASKCFTAFWGVVAIGFALLANLSENLIQAANILGSVFYGVPLGLFLIAFFVRSIGGTAVFWGALLAQALICYLYFLFVQQDISYLWLNPIGCGICMLFSFLIQAGLPRGMRLPDVGTAT